MRGVGSAMVGQVAGRSSLALLGSGLSRPDGVLGPWSGLLGLDEVWQIGNGPEIGLNKNGLKKKT